MIALMSDGKSDRWLSLKEVGGRREWESFALV